MEENVYQTPKADLSVEKNYADYRVASTGQRFSNMLLDSVFFLVFAVLVGIVAGVLGVGEHLMGINDNLFGIILLTMYYLPQEAIFGRTLAKLITKTKVVGLNGEKVTFLKALGRTLCRFIPFEAFTFLGGNGQPHGIHDKLPKTKVITLKTT